MVIAIDGPAGAGKSTVARLLARRLGITYLDSGAMYRCVALVALEAGVEISDPDSVVAEAAKVKISFDGDGGGPSRVFLSDRSPGAPVREVTDRIRDADVSAAASRVSAFAGVRELMVAEQRRLISGADYVAEGRDIGTVVSPESPLKIYLSADEHERARRRAQETGQRIEAVLALQEDRDSRDRNREHGALKPAEDAVEIDSTSLPVDIVVERIASLAIERGLT